MFRNALSTAVARATAATIVATAIAAPCDTSAQERASAIGRELIGTPTVAAAIEAAKTGEAQVIEDQVRLCEIPAPPFKEQQRAERFRHMIQALGLEHVRTDAVGNVLGERRGLAPRPHLVFSAHLDTVFPEGTDVKVTREGTVLKGPGIGDDCRGLAVVLGVIRALNAGAVRTPGTITFVGTVGEEGLGDLRGVKHLFERELAGRVDRFVSVDGAGIGITHVGVGSKRYRVAFKGPGGHSYGAFGIANPVHALGRAVAKISELRVPAEPKTTFNVGRIGGGTSVNSIAFEAWMEVDMRSVDPAALAALEAGVLEAVDAALAEENARWDNRGRLVADKELVGDRPAGRTSATSSIVEAAIAVTKSLGLPVALDESSTDSNIPMSLGIPAITIDAGGRGSGSHSLAETFDSTDSWLGTARGVLLATALAQP